MKDDAKDLSAGGVDVGGGRTGGRDAQRPGPSSRLAMYSSSWSPEASRRLFREPCAEAAAPPGGRT